MNFTDRGFFGDPVLLLRFHDCLCYDVLSIP